MRCNTESVLGLAHCFRIELLVTLTEHFLGACFEKNKTSSLCKLIYVP
jgi:hypothetical protein